MSAEIARNTIPEDQQTEVSMASTYAIVYERNGDQWGVVGDGWTEVHLYRDEADGTFRIIAWAVSNEEVLMNSNVTGRCKYTKKANDFHKYVDENDAVWGFGFYQDENSALKAKEFMSSVVDAISNRTVTSNFIQKSKGIFSKPSANPNLVHYGGNNAYGDYKEDEASRVAAIGPLTIGAAKPAKSSTQKPLPVKISEPIKVIRERHVSFDERSKTFRGLPEEWQEQLLGHSFGIPLKHVKSMSVQGYDGDIPKVLVTMRTFLENNGGYDSVGIFRIAPDASICKVIRDQLDRDVFENCQDVNCVANCIKIFFRELPKALLAVADLEEIKMIETSDQAAELIEKLPNPERSVFTWLLDMCVDVTQNANVNKMSPQNLAIVIAPNLFVIKDSEDPLNSVLISQKVVQFMYNGILWRSQLYEQAAYENDYQEAQYGSGY